MKTTGRIVKNDTKMCTEHFRSKCSWRCFGSNVSVNIRLKCIAEYIWKKKPKKTSAKSYLFKLSIKSDTTSGQHLQYFPYSILCLNTT